MLSQSPFYQNVHKTLYKVQYQSKKVQVYTCIHLWSSLVTVSLPVNSWCIQGSLLVRLSLAVQCGSVQFCAVQFTYSGLCVHVQPCARLAFMHMAGSTMWKAARAVHITKMLPSFLPLINITFLESTHEKGGQDFVTGWQYLWFSPHGPH